MIFNRITRSYMSPENGAEVGNGGGEPAPKKEEQGTPEVKPVEPEIKPDDTKLEEKEAKPTSKDDVELPPKEVDKSKLNRVTGLIEQAGLSMVEVATYAKANDGELDSDTIAKLQEKHGEAVASLIADQVKGIHAERTAEANKRDNEVYDQVKEAFKDVTDQTGEETWKELATWSKENVSNEHRAEINKLLAQGGLATKLAVQELATAFKESQGKQEFQDADLMDGDKTPQTNDKTISRNEYNTELNKLIKAGHQYGESREIASLDARRSKSIQRGIK